MTARRYWRPWWSVHVRWWLKDVRLLLSRTISEYTDDHCPQLAAGIAYYFLFSMVPLAILVGGVSGLVLRDDRLRAEVIDTIVSALPLAEGEARAQLDAAFGELSAGFSLAVLGGISGLLWSAAGVMGALRFSLNQAWDVDYRRPMVTGKLVDLLLVFVVGILLIASVGSTLLLQVMRRMSSDLSRWLGFFDNGATLGVELLALALPFTLSCLTFLLILTWVPSVRTRVGYVWPGALLAAVWFEVLKNGFAFYLRNFGDYDAVYGSLGVVVAFLFFVYLAASGLLLGAEMAAEYPRVTHGLYDELPAVDAQRKRRGALGRLRGFVRNEQAPPEHIPDAFTLAGRRARRIREEIEARSTRHASSSN